MLAATVIDTSAPGHSPPSDYRAAAVTLLLSLS